MKFPKLVLFPLICLFLGLASNVHAQNKAGIISYKGIINKTYVDSFLTALKAKKEVPMHIKQGVAKWYRNAKPDEYQLHFKNGESYYYHIPSLNAEEGYNIGSKARKNPYYTNNATDTIVEMGRFLGNIAHCPLNWEITGKTKKIGNYLCSQAIAIEPLYGRQGNFSYEKVVAWFAPKIPLSFGPKHYKGLPGLVLQIKRDKFTITATKINLNPDEKDIRIKRLDKNDKVITLKEANIRVSDLKAERKRKRSQGR